MTNRVYVSRDCDGLTKLWRHEPQPVEGPTGVYYHGLGAMPLCEVVDSTAFPDLGLGQCGPMDLDLDRVTGDGEHRKHGRGQL